MTPFGLKRLKDLQILKNSLVYRIVFHALDFYFHSHLKDIRPKAVPERSPFHFFSTGPQGRAFAFLPPHPPPGPPPGSAWRGKAALFFKNPLFQEFFSKNFLNSSKKSKNQ